MKIVSQTFWLPKAGNTPEEYEDAACPMEPVDISAASFKCAVADGATETSFARLWAQLLVSGYVEATALEDLQGKWTNFVAEKQLPWYAEEKLESGAYAALVGLSLTEKDKERKWQAEAVGDSCLLHVRKEEILLSFPLTRSDQFDSRPFLISSNPQGNESLTKYRLQANGKWKPSDVFYLLSDAIASWTLRRHEEKHDAVKWLDGIVSQESLIAFADMQREARDADGRPLMRNDDVTILKVQIS